jgi:apolipoprotein N-acyltransferase
MTPLDPSPSPRQPLSVRLPRLPSSVRPFVAAVSSGLLLVLSAPGVIDSRWPALLAWVAFLPLLRHLPRASVPRAALLGWLAGLVVTLGACSWFPGLLARFSGLHPLVAIALALALAAYQALGWAAWAAIVRVASPALPLALVAPATFVAIERWMPVVFPGSIGITQYRFLGIAQLAELGGPWAVSFLLVLAGAALAVTLDAARNRRAFPWRTLAATGAVLAFALIFGVVRLRQLDAVRARAPSLHIAAIQAGVVRSGWHASPDDPERLARYQQVSGEVERMMGPVDLLLWPEKAYPLPLRHDARHDYREDHPGRVRRGFAGTLLFGATSVEPRTRDVGNSAALLAPDGTLRVVYDKVRLIFYSEWLPSWLAGWVGGGNRYRPGSTLDPFVLTVRDPGDPARVHRVPISVFICFEATFPDHVRELVARGPRLLVNLSDDSWFAETSEPEQHLASTVFRAIESRRDIVRATGSGVSAFLAATGDIERRTGLSLSPAESGVALVARVRLLDGVSFYSAAGELFPAACALVALAGVLVCWRRSRRR